MDSSLGDTIYNILPRLDAWNQDALEQIQLSVYHGLELFTVFMAAFFCLFMYYFVFGFVVESLAESNMKDMDIKVDEMPATKTNGENRTMNSKESGRTVKLEDGPVEGKRK